MAVMDPKKHFWDLCYILLIEAGYSKAMLLLSDSSPLELEVGLVLVIKFYVKSVFCGRPRIIN